MARPGRPRAHDPIADDIRQAIMFSTLSETITLIQQTDIDITDGDLRTPLIHAVSKDKYEIVTWLLSQGAKIDHQDRDGLTALHFAVQRKNLEIVECLLKERANIEVKDIHGNTPLWRAVFDARGNYDLVKLLIQHGASSDSKNNANRSPLDFANQIADHELVTILQMER